MIFFEHLFKWFRRKFGFAKVAPTEAAVPVPEPTPVVEVSKQPGLSCPECGTRIPISFDNLLRQVPVVCQGCQLVLHVDPQQSKGALSALQKLQDGLAAAGKTG